MTNPEQSALLNAQHLTRVLAHLTANPKAWDAAWTASGQLHWNKRNSARGDAWGTLIQDKTEHPQFNGVRTLRNVTNLAKAAAWDAALALTAYKDSAKYLDMDPEELRVWAALSEDPAAIMLLPTVIAMNTK